MKLKTRKSYLRSSSEGTAPPAPKARITQWLYQLLLFLVIGYLLYLAYNHFRYIGVRGQVLIDKVVISSAHGGEIIDLPVRVGQLLQPSQLIARVAPPKVCNEFVEEDSRIERVQFEIDRASTRIHRIKKQLSQLADASSVTQLKRALEVNRASEPDQQHLSREKLRLTNELDESADELRALRSRLRAIQARPQRPQDPLCSDEQLRAPYASRVVLISTQAHEVASRDEAVVVLEPIDQPAYIEAYFDFEDFQVVANANQATVHFPDGHTELAKIEEVVSDARQRLPVKNADGWPLIHGLRAVLRPLSPKDAMSWKQYDRMEVEVRVKR